MFYGRDVKSDRARVQEVLVDLVNSDGGEDGEEQLGGRQDLVRLVERWIVTEAAPPSENDVIQLRRFRSSLRSLFVAEDRQLRIAVINDVLAGAHIQPRLAEHDGLPLHIHYFPRHASVADHLIADCAMELALMFQAGEDDRLKVCAAPRCGTAFIDRSKNRSRLYCDSQSCGNRLHAAAYRARHST